MKHWKTSTLLGISLLFLISCVERRKILITPDNKWRPVYSVQNGQAEMIQITKKKKQTEPLTHKDNSYTQIRIIRTTPFPKFDNLADTLPDNINPDTDRQRTEDFGPQDISQDGACYLLRLEGLQVLARTTESNTYLILKPRKHGKQSRSK